MEQSILECWSITNDIDTLRESHCKNNMSQDQLDNYLLGLETIYNVKFQKLFDLFEKHLKENKSE